VVDFYPTRDYDTMSTTVPHEAASTTDKSLPNLLFDYPNADIILRSQGPSHFRVPKIYIFIGSPVLGELIRSALDLPRAANDEPLASLPVVQLPDSGEIVHCLLTFIFPVTSLLPSTPEQIMELLSVAQKYQMETALTNIRGAITQKNSLPTGLEPALRIYSLAQNYGLRQEALQSARTILQHPMTVEDLVDKPNIMPGAYLYELWKYHEKVRAILVSDLTEFRASGARSTMIGVTCTSTSTSQIPWWLDEYIKSIGTTPNLFDLAELNIAMASHFKDWVWFKGLCGCVTMPSQTIRNFWEALASVVHGSFAKVSTRLLCGATELEALTLHRQSRLYLSCRTKRTLKPKSI
jgi:hypothetical protein